jgi:hypothetical protein
MCIFLGEIERVFCTNIYSRLFYNFDGGPPLQSLIYSMGYKARSDVAMVLPIPCESKPQFVNLEDYKELFDDLTASFVPKQAASASISLGLAEDELGILAVEQVGAYDASYVPSARDLNRLDPRLDLPEKAKESLSSIYNGSFGYVVFNLRAGETKSAHPMAFIFASRLKDYVFFPTTHIHDGKFHRNADFDHSLFMQLPKSLRVSAERPGIWKPSLRNIEKDVRIDDAEGLLQPGIAYHAKIQGHFKNQDIAFNLKRAVSI